MTPKIVKLGFLIAIICAPSIGCYGDMKVIQGTVAFYDNKSQVIELIDERPPFSKYSLQTGKAEMGAEPSVNDKVRIAYRVENGNLVALRVMKVSKDGGNR